jgi:hypothetical protein
MADANSSVYILETVKVQTRQTTGNVGQANFSPDWEPNARVITDDASAAPTRHGESIILLSGSEANPIDVVPDDQYVQLDYVVMFTDKPVNVTFTQATVARSLVVRGTFLLDCSYTGYRILENTLHVKALLVSATQVRVYWAGKQVLPE